jgi:hypothetical protein
MSTLPSSALETERTFFPTLEEMYDIADEGRAPTRDQLRQLHRKGAPGRPPGSKNRAQQKFAAYFIGKFGDPADVLGEIMTMPLVQLLDHMEAAQGGDAKHKPVRAIDGLRCIMEAADKVHPYVRGKQPISIEVTGRKDMVLLVGGINAPKDIDEKTLSDAISEHGLAALDPDTGELLLLPTKVSYDEIPDDDGDDG